MSLSNLRKMQDRAPLKKVVSKDPETKKIFSSQKQTGFPVGQRLKNYYGEYWYVKENHSAQYYLATVTGSHCWMMKFAAGDHKPIDKFPGELEVMFTKLRR